MGLGKWEEGVCEVEGPEDMAEVLRPEYWWFQAMDGGLDERPGVVESEQRGEDSGASSSGSDGSCRRRVQEVAGVEEEPGREEDSRRSEEAHTEGVIRGQRTITTQGTITTSPQHDEQESQSPQDTHLQADP